MEVKKYNPFVVIKKHKPKDKAKGASTLVPQSLPKTKNKLETRGFSLENKKKLDIIYAKGFVKSSRK